MAKTRWIVQSSHFALAQECASTLSAPEAPEVVHSLRASLAHLIVSTGLETTAFFFLKAGAAAGSDEAEAGSGFSAHDFIRFAGGFRDRGVAIVTQAAGSAPCLFRTQAHVKLLLATLVEQEHPQVLVFPPGVEPGAAFLATLAAFGGHSHLTKECNEYSLKSLSCPHSIEPIIRHLQGVAE